MPQPVRDDLTNSAIDLAKLVRAVGHPRIRMVYDTFHAHIEESPEQLARRCGVHPQGLGLV
jgi:sugar phosphate isomerase/epimerase